MRAAVLASGGCAEPPCADEPDRFTAGQFSAQTVNDLAAKFCDACPIRGECYRSALRDEQAWGVYGGVLFAHGRPVPPSQSRWFRPRVRAAA